jgi:RNA polymerase sigma-70 factor (ECF subfamily)
MTPPEPISDGTLISAVLAGETPAFEQLVDRYQGPLGRVARSRMGRPDWAEDVVQETFLCAFKSLHTYNSQYSFRTWLWTILLNQCRRQLKRFSRGVFIGSWEQEASDEDRRATLAEELKSEESPSTRLAAQERSELLDTLLAKLPEAQADALRLRFFGGLKFHEIADAMGCSLSTAKNRVRWGLTKMAEFLGPEDDLPIDRSLEITS